MHDADGVAEADDVFVSALVGDVIEDVGEAGDGDVGTAKLGRVGEACDIRQAFLSRVVRAGVQADAELEVVVLVVADAELVDDVGREEEGVAEDAVAADELVVDAALNGGEELERVEVDVALEDGVTLGERLVGADGVLVVVIGHDGDRGVVVAANDGRGTARSLWHREGWIEDLSQLAERGDAGLQGGELLPGLDSCRRRGWRGWCGDLHNRRRGRACPF